MNLPHLVIPPSKAQFEHGPSPSHTTDLAPNRHTAPGVLDVLPVLGGCGRSGVPPNSIQTNHERFQPAILQNTKESRITVTRSDLGREDHWRKKKPRDLAFLIHAIERLTEISYDNSLYFIKQ